MLQSHTTFISTLIALPKDAAYKKKCYVICKSLINVFMISFILYFTEAIVIHRQMLTPFYINCAFHLYKIIVE